MNCPMCKSENLYTVDSRQQNFGVQRRKKCADCGHRFTTAEIPLDEYKELKAFCVKALGAMGDLEAISVRAKKCWNGGDGNGKVG